MRALRSGIERQGLGGGRRCMRALGAWVLWMALLVSSAGCASCETAPVDGYEDDIDALAAAELARVALGSGDVFEVTVWGEPSMSGTYRLGPDGVIVFPMVGEIQVEGLTPSECAAKIRERLQDGYIREPNVSVYLKELNSKKIFVLGEVVRPGTFPFTPSMTIVEAITAAGGFSASANRDNVIVTRRGEGGDTRTRLPVEKITRGEAPNFGLRPGDIVFVPDRLL
jgi:protein involved in polysaccharide export with SLBB domain